jgi:hypothetical protein
MQAAAPAKFCRILADIISKEKGFCGKIRFVKGLHFQKIQGGAYRVLFYIGEFFVPVDEDLIQDLKKQANGSPKDFLSAIQEKLGYNAYLKSAIQEVLSSSNDPAAQAKSLMTEIRAL